MLVRFNGQLFTNVKDEHGVLGFRGLTHIAVAPDGMLNDVTEIRPVTEKDIERFESIGVGA